MFAPVIMRQCAMAVVVIASLLLTLPTVFAQGSPELNAASSAYRMGDYQTALRIIRALAETGLPEAQTKLGYLFCEGKAVPRDDAYAFSLLRSAANSGLASAQYTLGGFYENGFCVPQNSTESARLFALAAQQGHAGAEFYHATGFQGDTSEWLKWLRRAAEHGDVNAMSGLGIMAFGLKDYGEAVKWCLKTWEAIERKELKNSGSVLMKNIKNICGAMLGTMYLHGMGTDKNYELAVKYLSAAASQGNSVAQFELGRMYMSGIGELHDPNRAVELLKGSAEQGYVSAQKVLAAAYATGIGGRRDMVLAYVWAMLAAKSGDEEAARNLLSTRALLSRKEVAKAEQLAREWKPRPQPQPVQSREQTLAEFSPF